MGDSGISRPHCNREGDPLAAECVAGLYSPRKPEKTPLYQLVETHYETVKGLWEERFERSQEERERRTLDTGT
jgi:hypothetical protein